MDSHGQLGPDKGNYEADVRLLASCLMGGAVYAHLADRGGVLRLVLLLGSRAAPLPDGATPTHIGDEPREWLFVGVVGRGAYWFKLGQNFDPDYIAGKLAVEYGDGEIINEFLTRLAAAFELKEVVR